MRLRVEEADALLKRCTDAEDAVAAARTQWTETIEARAAVWLEVFEAGLSVPEIAEGVGRSRQLVQSEISKARAERPRRTRVRKAG